EENIQARIRGNLLMALSNKFGWLVLTTGNKSEYSVGYTTLYGDMAGGFAVIKDVPKMLVYDVARHVNARAGRAIIPETVFTRAPSAELRPNQTDQDTLPPYAELDRILEGYVEEDRGVNDLIARGFPADTVRRVVSMWIRTSKSGPRPRSASRIRRPPSGPAGPPPPATASARAKPSLGSIPIALTVRALIGIMPEQGETVVLKPTPGSGPGADVVGRIAAPQ